MNNIQQNVTLIRRRFFVTALTAFIYQLQLLLQRPVAISHSSDKRYFEDLLKHLEKLPTTQFTESTGDAQLRMDGIQIDNSENTMPVALNLYMPVASGEIGKFVVDDVRRRTVRIPIQLRIISNDLIDDFDIAEDMIDLFTNTKYFKFEWMGLQLAGAFAQQEYPEVLTNKMSAVSMDSEDNTSFVDITLEVELQYYAFQKSQVKYLSDDLLKRYRLNLTEVLQGIRDKVVIEGPRGEVGVAIN